MTVGRRLPPAAALTVVALAVGLALGLKARRYAGGAAPPLGDVHDQVERAMAAAGWTAGGVLRFPEGMPMLAAEFARPGCPRRLTVAYLGRSVELMPYVRLALGAEARLVAIGLDGGRIEPRDGGGAHLLAVRAPGTDVACGLPPLLDPEARKQ